MAAEREIDLDPDSEIAQALKSRNTSNPLVVTLDGVRYRMVREVRDPFEGYDVNETMEALRSLRGIMSDEAAEELRAAIRFDRDNERRDAERADE
ncbi:MAG: hypothetical protein IT334_10515 [Thermomicrobiales bacterium]|nr:hypothetical protein [Thermomicrobiales bacterium]